jgi:hypothetical protein
MALSELQEFKMRRMRIEAMIDSAKKSENQAKFVRQSLEDELHKLQRDCKHENVIVNGSWQGGGLYYDNAHCIDCNKKESRYNRETTLKREKEWIKGKDESYYENKVPLKSHEHKYNW